MKSLFITGTDTNVGKTFVSALIALHVARHNKTVLYHKPIQTGGTIDDDASTVNLLTNDSHITTSNGLVFEKPLSPHAAAFYEGTVIDFDHLVALCRLNKNANLTIFEGAGGILVPINKERLMIDLMQTLKPSVIVVARSGLGTINHTLLSLEALRKRALPILGIAMVGDYNKDNEEAIRWYGNIDNIIAIPWLNAINKTSLHQLALEKQTELNKFLDFAPEPAKIETV